jgi:RNA-binding protein NOB1
MSTNTMKPLHSLVLDAGPIIKNDPSVSTLLSQAEELYTIPAVIDEIRDAAARSRVETTLLPFLKLRTPKPTSIKVITDFARRTGDLEVLSRPDVHVLALAYELECERNHGDWRLRSMPGQKRVNGPPPASLLAQKKAQAEAPAATFIEPDPKEPVDASAPEAPEPAVEAEASELVEVSQQMEAVSIDAKASDDAPSEERVLDDAAQSKDREHVQPEPEASMETVEEVEASGSDDEGWITPSNIKKHKEKDAEGTVEPQEEQKVMQVACITSDFAMQNVLLRMNLNLLSPSLQRIRQLKTWVLRCHACFNITKDMSKQFCSRCGKDTLMRASCSTDKDGNFKVHLKKNMQWNNRGNVFSIPKPVAGTANGKNIQGGGKGGWGNELILAEDQKEYVNAMTTARRRKERDLMDQDYLPSILSGDRRGSNGKPKVGGGRNVNSKKRH